MILRAWIQWCRARAQELALFWTFTGPFISQIESFFHQQVANVKIQEEDVLETPCEWVDRAQVSISALEKKETYEYVSILIMK